MTMRTGGSSEIGCGHASAKDVSAAGVMPSTQGIIAGTTDPIKCDVRDGGGCERLEERQLLAIVALVEDVLLQVRVRWEVDRRERNVAKQARARALVEPKKAELADDVDRPLRRCALDLRRLALHLKPDLPVQTNSAISILRPPAPAKEPKSASPAARTQSRAGS